MDKNNKDKDQKERDEEEAKEFKIFEDRMNALAHRKLGFPTSLLGSNSSFVHYELLGIRPGSLASILINHAGDPFVEADTYQMEVKNQEVMLISAIASFLGIPEGEGRGYVTTGGTEGNAACLRWCKQYCIQTVSDVLAQKLTEQKSLLKNLEGIDSELKKTQSGEMQNREQIQKELQLLRKARLLEKDLRDTENRIDELSRPSLFCTKDHTHYSVAKIADNLSLKYITVQAEDNGSMNIEAFAKQIEEHLKLFPSNPIIVSANIGTTFMGAIDNVPKIKSVLENMTPKPIYAIHMDGALNGFVLPILKPFGEINHYFEFANTMAISFHKYLGLPQPIGLALTTKQFLDVVCKNDARIIEYAGNIKDITLSGSRSGFNVLLVYNAVVYALNLQESKEKITELVKSDLERANYFAKKLSDILGKENVIYMPNQFNIIIPKPSDHLIRKYQLMTMKNKSVICVLHNVNYELIEQFIKDIQQETKNRQQETNANSSETKPKLEEKKSC